MPIDIVKRILSSNVNEIKSNIKECIVDCDQMVVDPRDKQTKQVFATEIYECKHNCLYINKKIINDMENRLASDLPKFKH